MGSFTRLHQLAARQHGLATTTQARRVGVSAKQLRSHIAKEFLIKVAPTVLKVAGSPPTIEQEILAAAWSCGPTGTSSYLTAAWLHEFDNTTYRPRPNVTVIRPARGNHSLARVRQTLALDDVDRTTVRGIPATTPTRTIIDAAADTTPNQLEVLLDSALRNGLTSKPRLLWRLEALGTSGRPGVANLLALLGEDQVAQQRCESWLESESLRLFRRAGLPRPEVQRVERDRNGKVIRCDFAFGEGLLVVEVSGHKTHSTRQQRRADAERRAELALLGIVHLEFTYEDVTQRPDYVTQRVFQFLDALQTPSLLQNLPI